MECWLLAHSRTQLVAGPLFPEAGWLPTPKHLPWFHFTGISHDRPSLHTLPNPLLPNPSLPGEGRSRLCTPGVHPFGPSTTTGLVGMPSSPLKIGKLIKKLHSAYFKYAKYNLLLGVSP